MNSLGKRRECEWAMVDECRGGPMASHFPSFATWVTESLRSRRDRGI